MASLGSLYPGLHTTVHDRRDVAAVKGSGEMADLLRRAVRSRQVVPTETVTLDVEGERLVVPPQLVADAMRRAQDRGKPHNVARVNVQQERARRDDPAAGRPVAAARDHGGRSRREGPARGHPQLVRRPRPPQHRVAAAAGREAARGPVRPAELARVPHPELEPGAPSPAPAGARCRFTVEDVPLLDEAAELLGVFDPTGGAAKRQAKASRNRDIENARQAIENMGVEGIVSAEQVAGAFAEGGDPRSTAERAAEDREWTYGHIVVDEAQSSPRCSGGCSHAGTRSARSRSWATWRRVPRPAPPGPGTTSAGHCPGAVAVVRRRSRSTPASRS